MIPDVLYRFTIRPLPDDEGGGYLIEFPDLPGCMSDGATIEEAIMGGLDAMRGWMDSMRAEGYLAPPTQPLDDHRDPLQGFKQEAIRQLWGEAAIRNCTIRSAPAHSGFCARPSLYACSSLGGG